jgi:hypothetical protein
MDKSTNRLIDCQLKLCRDKSLPRWHTYEKHMSWLSYHADGLVGLEG